MSNASAPKMPLPPGMPMPPGTPMPLPPGMSGSSGPKSMLSSIGNSIGSFFGAKGGGRAKRYKSRRSASRRNKKRRGTRRMKKRYMAGFY